MGDARVSAIREASRRLIRELGFLEDGRRTLGITHAQCHALIEVERAGACTVSALAEALSADKSTVSRTTAKLVAQGLLTARSDPADGRKKHLVLTEAGRARLVEIHEHADRQVRGALASLPEEERDAVIHGLSRYARALRRARRSAEIRIRPLEAADDPEVAALIRAVMPEFGAEGPGFAINDPEVGAMSAAYGGPGAGFFVVERGGRVLGGAGFAHLTGGDPDTCELRKMYFYPELRGLGVGARLLDRVLDEARRAGYRRCYLETLEHMHAARRLYEKAGFRPLSGPLGDTGHFSCDAWYARDL